MATLLDTRVYATPKAGSRPTNRTYMYRTGKTIRVAGFRILGNQVAAGWAAVGLDLRGT